MIKLRGPVSLQSSPSGVQKSKMPEPLFPASEVIFHPIPALSWQAQVKFARNPSGDIGDFSNWLQSRGYMDPKEPIPPKSFEKWLRDQERVENCRPFQKEGMTHLSNGCSVLVSADTGSGKTLVAEYAIRSAVRRGEGAFYTTPRKALCNDKYRELRQHFGKENVGLMTGDYTENEKAPVMVMTTEVLRDMLYNHKNNRSHRSPLSNVGVWIDDECHSLGTEKDRGLVWEECIMLLPLDIQQVHLSATIGNAEQFNDWLNELSPDSTKLVSCQERPVPLYRYFYSPRGKLVPLYEENRQLTRAFKEEFPESWNPEYFTSSGKQYASMRPAERMVSLIKLLKAKDERVSRDGRDLKEFGFLPLNAFYSSRAACNLVATEYYKQLVMAEDAGDRQYTLLNSFEKKQVSTIIQQHLQNFPWLNQIKINEVPFIQLLKKGIGVHHAGMLPAQKQLVEDLLKEGLLKVNLSTSTLALGINVPIKTTVIPDYECNGELISQSDIQQMVGRAGRPGMYPRGYTIFFPPIEDMGQKEFLSYINAPPAAIHSQLFNINPKMVLNFLKNYQSESFENFVAQSFASYCEPTRTQKLIQQFDKLLPALQQQGFVNENGTLTPLGQLAAIIPSEYDLLIAKAIESRMLEDLTPAQLAAVLSTTMTENIRGDKVLRAQDEAEIVTQQKCEALSKQLFQLREAFPADEAIKNVLPESLKQRLVLIIQRWCERGDWNLVLHTPNTYPGDIFSAIRRTAGLLDVIARTPSPHISVSLARKAKIAYDLLRREEINKQIIP